VLASSGADGIDPHRDRAEEVVVTPIGPSPSSVVRQRNGVNDDASTGSASRDEGLSRP